MRFAFIAALALSMLAFNAQAKEIYKAGSFTVRKVEGVCKLEIALSTEGSNDSNVILALFSSEDYYSELFTEKNSIGLARKEVDFRFDKGNVQSISFVTDSAGKDSHWRWQYLDHSRGLLDNIKRGREMRMSFRSQKGRLFRTALPLSGSSKAVRALERCR